MDDYISRKVAIQAAEFVIGRDTSGENAVVNAMTAWNEYIKGLPSADVQPVVRCKDCRLSEHNIGITEYWCCYWDNKTLENGYCSYGERKV